VKRKTIALAIVAIAVLAIVAGLQFMRPAWTAAAIPALARPAAQVPTTTTLPSATDLGSRVAALEERMARLEATQTQHIAALDTTISQLKFVLGGLAGLLTLIVGVQALFQFGQSRMQHAGVRQVSEVMDVVTKTLESRLTAEEEARKEKLALEQSISGIQSNLEALVQFRKSFDAIIVGQRREIEETAEELAQTSRHDFRLLGDRLRTFSRHFDTFKEQYQPIGQDSRELSAKARYIRGIAALYANDPEQSRSYLQEVVQLPADNEPQISHDRRVANAYYYLGITDSNFMTGNAAASFDEALRRDAPNGDFLTRVVAAETRVMGGETDTARTAAREIVAQIDMKFPSGRLTQFQRRLRSRAILVQANVEIVQGNDGYGDVVQELLVPVFADDPRYYYAIVTMAQTHTDREPGEAQALFSKAYETIVSSNDLLLVTEVRSQLLLRMTAGLCCKQLDDILHSEEHLEKAGQLLRLLPVMNSVPCTVFSILSKCNESSAAIEEHLRSIREGHLLLPGRGCGHAAAIA